MTTQKRPTLLVPVDGSAEAEAAFPVASRLAMALDAEVLLLQVTNLPETGAQAADARDAAHMELTRLSKKLSCAVRVRVEETGAVEGILRTIADEKPDMIIMATHGKSGLSSMVEGSVAQEVVTTVSLPVTLVHTPEESD
jgi:nucleotide-binding universal stress UspA family protein